MNTTKTLTLIAFTSLISLNVYAANNITDYKEFWYVIGFLVGLFVLYLLREVNTWYWKINEIVTLLKEQNQYLKAISGVRNRSDSGESVENPSGTWTCPKCGAENSNTSYKCKQCQYSLR